MSVAVVMCSLYPCTGWLSNGFCGASMLSMDDIARLANDIIARYPKLFGSNYDALRNPQDCLHCHGTTRAPGDGRTECGFCDVRVPLSATRARVDL